MKKCDVRIEDPHFHDLHHALGRPWPDEVMDENRANRFAVDEGSQDVERLRASPHWTDGYEMWGMMHFHVTHEGRKALSEYMRESVETLPRYLLTFRDHDGTVIVPAKSRSAARYAAYADCDIDWTFMEYAAEIKSIRLYDRGNPSQLKPAASSLN